MNDPTSNFPPDPDQTQGDAPAQTFDQTHNDPGITHADAGQVASLEEIRANFQKRWHAGERIPVEEFLKQGGAPADDPTCVLELIFTEMVLRLENGEAFSNGEYIRRFPAYEAQLLAAGKSSRRADNEIRGPEAYSMASPKQQAKVLPPEAKKGSGTPQAIAGYEILAELGRGGMGVVYKARQVSLKRLVALKVLRDECFASPDDLGRFRLEAETLASLQHPHVVQIYEVGEWEGRPFCALELVEGGSLDQMLKKAPLAAREAAHLVETLARAMHAVHQKGIIHRDLKPANVLLTPNPKSAARNPKQIRRTNKENPKQDSDPVSDIRNSDLELVSDFGFRISDFVPKVTDFGLAKRLDTESDQTRTGTILGTPSYMAPEQAGGQKDIGPATDVYALGAILYDALTGRPPFKAATAMETVFQVLAEEPIPVRRLQPRVPLDLETIVHKCLQKAPKKRYPSAAALADDLGRFLAGEPILARPMGRAERLWRWCKRNPVAASLLLTVTLGAAFGMWYLSQLSETLVRSTALESAAQQAEMFDEVNTFYSGEIVRRAKDGGIKATHDYLRQPGTIPVPATFTIELGKHISDNSKLGQKVLLYSDEPFKTRKKPPLDPFESEALQHLKAAPRKPYYRFEDYQGRPSLRYATARLMKQTCVDCHNSHKDSPRHNWEVDDVRGVLEIIRPLDRDVERTQEGLRGTFALVAGFSATLLLLSSLILVLGRRRGGAVAGQTEGQGAT